MTVFNARALASLVTVAGNVLSQRLIVILNSLVKVMEDDINDELHEAVDEAINAYTLMVITMQTTMTNDLYFTDQFCGFDGSFGLFHVTIFASTVVSDCSSFVPPTRNSFGGGSWISSPPYRSKCSSPREVICSMCICGDAASLPNSSSCFVTSELYEIGLELGVC